MEINGASGIREIVGAAEFNRNYHSCGNCAGIMVIVEIRGIIKVTGIVRVSRIRGIIGVVGIV